MACDLDLTYPPRFRDKKIHQHTNDGDTVLHQMCIHRLLQCKLDDRKQQSWNLMFCLYLEPCVSSTLNTSKTSSCIVTALVNQLSIKLTLKPDLRTFHSLGSNYQIKAKYHKKLSNKTTLFASSKPSHHVLYEYDELFECFAPVQLRKKHTNIYSA